MRNLRTTCMILQNYPGWFLIRPNVNHRNLRSKCIQFILMWSFLRFSFLCWTNHDILVVRVTLDGNLYRCIPFTSKFAPGPPAHYLWLQPLEHSHSFSTIPHTQRLVWVTVLHFVSFWPVFQALIVSCCRTRQDFPMLLRRLCGIPHCSITYVNRLWIGEIPFSWDEM